MRRTCGGFRPAARRRRRRCSPGRAAGGVLQSADILRAAPCAGDEPCVVFRNPAGDKPCILEIRPAGNKPCVPDTSADQAANVLQGCDVYVGGYLPLPFQNTELRRSQGEGGRGWEGAHRARCQSAGPLWSGSTPTTQRQLPARTGAVRPPRPLRQTGRCSSHETRSCRRAAARQPLRSHLEGGLHGRRDSQRRGAARQGLDGGADRVERSYGPLSARV